MKRIMLSLFLCGVFSMLYCAEIDLPAAPGGPKADVDKEAQAWVDKVLKEFPDKLDRLVMLNKLNAKGYSAYQMYESGKAWRAPQIKFPEKMAEKASLLLNAVPQIYPDIETYYSLLYKQSGIPDDCMVNFKGSKGLASTVKEAFAVR